MLRRDQRRFLSVAVSLGIVALLGLAVAGCGVDKSNDAREQALVRPVQDVGDLYRMYMLDHKKPPTKPDDFRPYQEANPDGYRQVKDGDVVVVWGVALTDLAPEGSTDSADEVLAYEKKVPTEGGTVLMKNRTLKHMTADQFKDAPKAAGAASPGTAAR
jgi:hypothetical protein